MYPYLCLENVLLYSDEFYRLAEAERQKAPVKEKSNDTGDDITARPSRALPAVLSNTGVVAIDDVVDSSKVPRNYPLIINRFVV